MSTVTKLESLTAGIMEPLINGGYVEDTIEAHAWRCDGCGLVWDRRWHAERCEQRGHVESFEQGPYGVRYVENGRPVGNLHWYTRRAIRREQLEAPAEPEYAF